MKIFLYTRKVDMDHMEFINQWVDFLIRRGCQLFVQENFLAINLSFSPWKDSFQVVSENNQIEEVDLAVGIGGDGTLLELSRFIGNYRIPIIGVNTGRLGFLSVVQLHQAKESFERILNQEFEIEHRSFISVAESEESETVYPNALNEVVIVGYPHNTMIAVHAYVNDRFLATYWADGLMLATPTGSTAYSLSCGGPIVSPDTNSFIITPIAPHNLNVRPLIIPMSQKVTFIPESREGKFMMNIDGQGHLIHSGARIVMERAQNELRLVKLKGSDFFDTIRNKMGWGFDQRN
jgi:NAD+ kinase